MEKCEQCGDEVLCKGLCRRCYDKQWYQENKEHRLATAAKYRKRTQEFVRRVKSRACCEVCGEDEPVCLDFHHTDPNDKEYNIAYVSARGLSIETAKREIRKCQIVCSNCHRKIEAGVI